MHMFRIAAVAIVMSMAAATAQNISREFPNGLVSDQKMAIAIAEAVLFHVYGERTIREQRPYIVKHVRDKWIIDGAPPPAGMAGGSFHIVISQRDGRILEITHDV
jgi:NTF2 fold immunity protein of polymorphic toxin system component